MSASVEPVSPPMSRDMGAVVVSPVVPVVSGQVPKAPRVEREAAATALTPADPHVATCHVTTRSDVQQAIDRFHDIFVTHNGSRPHITGKDAALAKQLVTRQGPGDVGQRRCPSGEASASGTTITRMGASASTCGR